MSNLTTLKLIIVLIIGASAWATDNTLTPEQQAAGWQRLFDGTTLDGWHIKSGFAKYHVEEGTIVGTTVLKSPNCFLCRDGTFADFELTFEARFDGAFFNSGVQIRSKLRGEEYGGKVYGPQVEIEESPGQSGFIYGQSAGGWQSPEPKSKDENVSSHSFFRNDGWNQYRVLAVGRRIQTWVNGHAVADLTYDQDRYKDNPEGFIGLQVHGVHGENVDAMRVRWKNIYIRPIHGDQDSTPDWGSPFNGRDFTGWRFHLGNEGADNNGTFTVENGLIVCTGQPTGYMYTEKSYSDFVLRYEWAFERPANLQDDAKFRGNSGCLIHIGEENVQGPWPRCIEVQGKHQQAGLILPIPRNVKCERTFDEAALAAILNPVGAWNSTEIDVHGKDMIVKVNGKQVSTVKDCELTSGHIGLQSENAPTRMRNIRLLDRSPIAPVGRPKD